MKLLRSVALGLITFLPALPAYPSAGYSPQFTTEVQNAFFNGSSISAQKISAFEAKAKAAQTESLAVLTNYFKVNGNLSDAAAREKALEEASSIAYSRLFAITAKLKSATGDAAIDLGAEALHLSYSLKYEGSHTVLAELNGYRVGFFKNFKVKYRNAQQAEAFNLINGTTGNFYTQQELSSIKANRGDVSKFNPQSNGRYWTNTDIENYKIDRTYVADSRLFNKKEITFPVDGTSFKYEGPKRSQSRPKFKVSTVINGKKYSYKFKFASEVHSEPTAASLMAALGYNTDPTQYIRSPKVYFSGPSGKAEFYRDLENYYGYWDFQPSIASEGKDANGEYIIFHEALLEGRDKDMERLGGWPFNREGHNDLREVRAMSLFMAWINNNDLKEATQNKVIVKNSDSPENLYYVNSDLGYTFGSFYYPGTVSWLKWNPIKSTSGDGVSFHYMTWHWTEMLDKVTFDDARWFTRRLARLSRQQIADAVGLGRWPKPLDQQLVEKLISRRDEMVAAFGLSNEFPALKADTSILPADNNQNAESNIPGQEGGEVPKLDFGYSIWTFLRPALSMLHSQLVTATADGRFDQPVRTQLRFGIGSMLGLAKPYANGLIFNVSRTVLKNREPRNVGERYLIHDQIIVGYELGGELAQVEGKATYYRAYNLIHPATDNISSYMKPDYLGNLLMPFAPGLAKLPPKYTMFIEDFIEGKGTVTFKYQNTITLEGEASLARVYLKRYLVSDKNDGNLNLLEDKSKYTELSGKIYATLGIIGFPLVQASVRAGHLDRDLWTVPVSGTNSNRRYGQALHQLVRNLDVSEVDKIAKKQSVSTDFLATRAYFNIFELFHSKDGYRRDNISEIDGDDASVINHSLQIESLHEQTLYAPAMGYGEQNFSRAFFMGVKNSQNAFTDTILGLNIKVWDTGTSGRELGGEYVALCNRVADDDTFIPFSPILHANRDQWGQITTQVDFLLYQEGIDALLKATPQEYWAAFQQVTGTMIDPNDHSGRPENQDPMVKSFRDVLSVIKSAASTTDRDRRANLLVAALQKSAVTTSMTSGIKGTVLGVLRRVAPESGMYISAKIAPPLGISSPFPEGKVLVNQIGELRYRDRRMHNFELSSYEQIYNFFDSVIPRDTTTPSRDLPY